MTEKKPKTCEACKLPITQTAAGKWADAGGVEVCSIELALDHAPAPPKKRVKPVCNGTGCVTVEGAAKSHSEDCALVRKPKPKKEPKPAIEFIPPEPRYCLDGCGAELLRPEGSTGRLKMYAKPYCATVVREARLAGWNEGNDLTARIYLKLLRDKKLQKPSIEESTPLTLINPVICACGCGRRARFASVACGKEIERQENAAVKAAAKAAKAQAEAAKEPAAKESGDDGPPAS